jgi:hypothetical protein
VADDVIPPDVREFIIRHIDTVSELEALLILRAHRGAEWDVGQIAARVYTPEREIAQVIERFLSEGFLERDGDRFRYNEKNTAADRTIGELAKYYASHLIPVTNMIHSKPRSMRSFSDAFKLRKDP